MGIVAYYWDRYLLASSHDTPELFFLLMATTFLIGTFCLLLSCLISLSTGGIISKTIYVRMFVSSLICRNINTKPISFQELIYHSIAFVLYLIAAIMFLVRVTDRRYGQLYEEFMVASVLGLIVSVLYLFSAIYAQRSYRGI